ncbi:ferritin, heavy subunit-like [Anopheles nili]|uniref:ferritin, heavy subunit-like n=1 Tax=Anopheles nili TaxID=185578 RepID=UPI00237B7AD4|nr:ferritin, heavy subunit-like [Anopheles nili]
MFFRRLSNHVKRFYATINLPPGKDSFPKATNLVPGTISESTAAAINKQINQEYGACYTYRSISYHFATSSVGLLRLADFYRMLASEENEHAEQLANFLLLRNGSVILEAIAKPIQRQWSADIGQTLCETLTLETELSASLSVLYAAAEMEHDVVLTEFLTSHFLHEQCESVRVLQLLACKWNQLRNAPHGVYLFDREIERMNGLHRCSFSRNKRNNT